MRPDNPNFRPCATYVDKPFRDRPGDHIGFDAVDKGWHPILDELDHQFVMITGMGTNEHTKIKVLQIKEKFGGLRVYVDLTEMPEDKRELIHKAIADAEERSFRTCEQCGTTEDVSTRGLSNTLFGRVLTLCEKHHVERDEREAVRKLLPPEGPPNDLISNSGSIKAKGP